jgi:hypothetical protein
MGDFLLVLLLVVVLVLESLARDVESVLRTDVKVMPGRCCRIYPEGIIGLSLGF